MSVGAISSSSTGVVNSPVAQSQDSDPTSIFANWLSSVQGGGQSTSSSNDRTGFPVSLVNPSAAFAAHLSNGLTVGMVALGPVSSADEQQMATSVEQQALNFAKAFIPTTAADLASESTEAGTPAPSGVGGAIGMYDALPDGIEIMGYTAGEANGGPSVQDMASGMHSIVTNLEKELGSSIAAS